MRFLIRLECSRKCSEILAKNVCVELEVLRASINKYFHHFHCYAFVIMYERRFLCGYEKSGPTLCFHWGLIKRCGLIKKFIKNIDTIVSSDTALPSCFRFFHMKQR